MKTRYEFVNNVYNVEKLVNAGFENVIGFRDYFYTNVEVLGNKVDIHTIYINKQTNLLTYRLNEKDYDYFNLFEINEMISRKITNLINTKVIIPTNRKETKERYKRNERD